MVRYFSIITILILFLAPGIASGQFTIRPESTLEQAVPDNRPVDPPPSESSVVVPSYVTEGMIRAERLRLRRERNTFSTTLQTTINQSMFSNWAKGGDNTFNGTIYLKANHTYKKERLSFITEFDSKLGLNIIDTVRFKNEDYFNVKHQSAWDISRFWSLAGTANLRSQYLKGYKSKSDNTLVSDFMSPGTLDLALGFRYKPKYWNVTLSPVTGKMIFVLSDTLSRKGINGVEPGKHFKPMVGSSLDVTFSRKFSKDRFGYDTKLKAFWNYTIDPTVSWESTFSLYTTHWLTTSFFWHMIYDREANVPHKDEGKYLQWSSNIGLAAVFTFKSKK